MKFASNKLYKATVDVFPGAIYLFDGSIDFLACALCLALYVFVKRHEKIYGTLGGSRIAILGGKITKTEGIKRQYLAEPRTIYVSLPSL